MSNGEDAASPARGHRVGSTPGGPPAGWRGQLLPVLLGLGGAAISLAIGIVGPPFEAHSPPPPRTSHGVVRRVPEGPEEAAPARTSSTTQGVSSSGRTCSPADLTITTTVDRSSYAPGVPVTVLTTLVVKTTCELVLVPSGEYKCGDSVMVDNSSGKQVFPAPGQGEQCGVLPRGLVTSGTIDSDSAVWNPRTIPAGATVQAPTGRYMAVGSWSWNAGRGKAPYELSVDSAIFTITP